MKIRIQQFYTLKIASGDNPSGSKTSAVARLAVWNRNTLNLKFLSVLKNGTGKVQTSDKSNTHAGSVET